MQLHRRAYGHRERVCTESWFQEKNPLPHWGIEPASAAWPVQHSTNWAASPLTEGADFNILFWGLLFWATLALLGDKYRLCLSWFCHSVISSWLILFSFLFFFCCWKWKTLGTGKSLYKYFTRTLELWLASSSWQQCHMWCDFHPWFMCDLFSFSFSDKEKQQLDTRSLKREEKEN